MDASEPVTKGYEVWQQTGFAGLFVVVFLSLCVLFALTVRMFLKKIESMEREAITAVKDSSQATRDMTNTLEDVKKSMDESAKQSAEALLYIRARDEFFGKHPPRR